MEKEREEGKKRGREGGREGTRKYQECYQACRLYTGVRVQSVSGHFALENAGGGAHTATDVAECIPR